MGWGEEHRPGELWVQEKASQGQDLSLGPGQETEKKLTDGYLTCLV
jgi:hypothetical protein